MKRFPRPDPYFVAGLAVPVLVAIYLYASRQPNEPAINVAQLARDLTELGLVHSLGEGEGKVEIVEFSDFECPACSEVHELTWPLIQSKVNSGVARFQAFDVVLPSHDGASVAAIFAGCAETQDEGKYWNYRELLYATQGDWSKLDEPSDYFASLAARAGLGEEEIRECVAASGALGEKLEEGFSLAVGSGLSFVPVIAVNGEIVAGKSAAEYAEAFRNAIRQHAASVAQN